MLVGYGASQLINFVVQVGIVRYLTKSEYGAFAWALAAVLLVQAVVPLGLDRASARFLSLFDERRDFPQLFGLILLEVSVIFAVGSIVVGGALVLRHPLENIAPSDRAVAILLVLIALAPIQALDVIIVEMFAVLSSPWAVFLRRYVMEPLLRLSVVILLIITRQDAVFLAVGFVVVGAVGLMLYLFLLRRLFQRIGLLTHFSWRKIRLPVRQVASFCGPLMLTSLVAVATTEFAAVVLGDLGGATQVAVFRAVQPFAVLNLGVLFAFTTLFTPSASRLLARGENGQVRDLYWQSAAWVCVLTFPVLAVTTALAEPFTVLTLGQRYATSAVVLMILSFGFYINAAFGFNGFTIQLLGRGRWVLATNVITLAAMAAATFLLVGRYQAVGAALAVLLTLIIHNLLKQLGLGFGAGIGAFQAGHARILVLIVIFIGALYALQHWLQFSLWLGLVLVFVSWLMLLRLTRHHLRLLEVFPEAGRIGVLRWLLGEASSGPVASRLALANTSAESDDAEFGPAPLSHWRGIDWRFLIPTGFTRVGFVGPVSAEETRVLREAGLQVSGDPTSQEHLDVLVITDLQPARLPHDLHLARPGGWVLLRLTERPATPWNRLGRGSPSSWMRRLRAGDLEKVHTVWHAPNQQRCSYLVDLADRLAVDAMLRRFHGVRFGRQKSILTRAANRLGLLHLVASDLTVVGQRPLTNSSHAVEDAAISAPIDLAPVRALQREPSSKPSTLLVTPWFAASRHVVALYLDRATGQLSSVAKLPRRPWDAAGITVEADALRAVHAAVPALLGALPQVCRFAEGERPYLLETALVGAAVSPEYVRAHPSAVLGAGVDLTRRLSSRSVQAAPDWYERLIESPLRRFAEVVPLSGIEGLVQETLHLLLPLQASAVPHVLEHGDLGHPNLIMTSATKMAAIDWERFEPDGLPGHDLAFFLQYVAESKQSTFDRAGQLEAFDQTFLDPRSVAADLLADHADRLGVDRGLLPPLVLAAWARTAAGLVDRLLGPATSADDAPGPTPQTLAETIDADRDFQLWRHALRNFDRILR